MIPIKDLLKTKWWEELVKVVKERQKALAGKILYWDGMDVKDENLTRSDLYRAELRCLNWIIDKLPEQLVENPNYNPDEDIEEMEDQERADLINDMFKQEI